MAPLRPQVRYQRVEESREEEVSIHLHSPSSHLPPGRGREACLRIGSALLLLMVAVGFVLYDLDLQRGKEATPGAVTGTPPPSPGSDVPEDNPHHHHDDSQSPTHHDDDDDEEEEGPPASHHHPGDTFHHAAAITHSETCSTLARDILQAEGSVVDAGVVAVLCQAVVHSHTSSLGGVFSSLYFNGKSRESSVLLAIPEEASPLQLGVPQVLQGLQLLHQKYGRKPWSELFRSAVIAADKGYLVDSILHAALEANRDKVVASPSLCRLFCGPGQSLKEVGERVENPQLARVLEKAASSMTGPVLPDDVVLSLLEDVEAVGREHFAEALSRRDLKLEDALTLPLDTLTLYTTGDPTAGHILSDLVRELYNKTQKPGLGPVPEVLLNSSKTAYTLGGAWPALLSSSVAPQQLPSWTPAPASSNVVIVNSDGDLLIVSLTLNSTFGSGLVSPSTGILFSDFLQGQTSPHGSGPVYWACPSVLSYGPDREDVMGLVASGGSPVPVSLAQVILGHHLLEGDLAESVSGSLVEISPHGPPDPWLEYLGLQGNGTPQALVAVEVRAEHVHVVESHGNCCSVAGL